MFISSRSIVSAEKDVDEERQAMPNNAFLRIVFFFII
jgi:hypothetical protein